MRESGRHIVYYASKAKEYARKGIYYRLNNIILLYINQIHQIIYIIGDYNHHK